MQSVTPDLNDKRRARLADRLVSIILVVIWGIGLAIILQLRPEIPGSMLLIGSVFFVVLIPAMKELVRTIERRLNPGQQNKK
jgi:hypothetical protein